MRPAARRVCFPFPSDSIRLAASGVWVKLLGDMQTLLLAPLFVSFWSAGVSSGCRLRFFIFEGAEQEHKKSRAVAHTSVRPAD
ncbi:unnamed protein product [Linum trigynum]|uniref:Secreted protein n=1 Tax=Linum trigynum TaxID=586398 RepID=A0AAV2DFK9_9ROSI